MLIKGGDHTEITNALKPKSKFPYVYYLFKDGPTNQFIIYPQRQHFTGERYFNFWDPRSRITMVYQTKEGLEIFYLYQKGIDFIMTNVIYSLSKAGTEGVLINIDEFKMREIQELKYTDSFCQKLSDDDV